MHILTPSAYPPPPNPLIHPETLPLTPPRTHHRPPPQHILYYTTPSNTPWYHHVPCTPINLAPTTTLYNSIETPPSNKQPPLTNNPLSQTTTMSVTVFD